MIPFIFSPLKAGSSYLEEIRFAQMKNVNDLVYWLLVHFQAVQIVASAPGVLALLFSGDDSPPTLIAPLAVCGVDLGRLLDLYLAYA